MELLLGMFDSALAARRARVQLQLEDEGRRKQLSMALQQGPSGGRTIAGYTGASVPTGGAAEAIAPALRPTAVRFAAMAKGSQPAVVKLASYGGGGRAGAMMAYVSREGGVRMENERGEILRGHGVVAKVLSEWDPLLDNRAFSKDVATFSMQIKGTFAGLDDDQLREVGRATLNGLLATHTEDGEDRHALAFGIERRGAGAATIVGVMVLRSREGLRRTPDAKGEAMIARAVIEKKGMLVAEPGQVRFTGFGNGVEYGTFQLRALVARHNGQVVTERGSPVDDGKRAGDLVQRYWRHEMQSRAPRDVMHIVMSAKAGTDAQAFEVAARSFLATQFAEQGHRYAFAMHDPATDPKTTENGGKRPHVHAHAIVTMRSDHGNRVRVSPVTFREWREVMAEKAREQGIAMEMTDRRDIGSAPAYTRNQVRPTSRTGRTEHEGTSRPAHERYVAKRTEKRVYARSERSQSYGVVVARTWGALALSSDRDVARFATFQLAHIQELVPAARRVVPVERRREPSAVFKANMVRLKALIPERADMVEGQQHEVLTRPQFELYEKSVNVAIHRAEREITDPEERTALNNFTKVVRDLVEAKRDLVETAAVMVEHAELRRQGVDVDGAYKRYDEAVAQHSEGAVKDGNALLLNMNRAHAAWSEAGHPESLDHPPAWIYYKEMTSVVEAARGGNGYLQDVVERSETLRIVAEEMQERQREARGSENATSQASGAGDQGEIDAFGLKHAAEDREEQRLAAEAQSVHEQHGRVDALHRAADKIREGQGRDANRQSADPAQQQVTRQDLQRREVDSGRDDDDFER